MALPPNPGLLRRAAREHRRLERQAAAVCAEDPVAVIHFGTAVMLHGLFEEGHLFAVHRLLDPMVQGRLSAAHDQLEDGLALLEEQLAASAPTEDLPLLASALARRLRAHVERDGRILYQPLERLGLLRT